MGLVSGDEGFVDVRCFAGHGFVVASRNTSLDDCCNSTSEIFVGSL